MTVKRGLFHISYFYISPPTLYINSPPKECYNSNYYHCKKDFTYCRQIFYLLLLYILQYTLLSMEVKLWKIQ